MSTSNSRPCDHHPVPALGSAGLQMFSYLPGPLVEQTRAFFEAGDLRPSQVQARDNFVFLFGLEQDETYTEVTTLEELAEHLDAFFFAGQLTGAGGGRRILRCLELEQDIFTAAPPTGGHGSYGDVHASMPLGESRLEMCPSGEWAIAISINPNNQDGMPAPLHSLLEALVHEMVHSFLQSFMCYGGSCHAERTVLLNRMHHGPLFVELLDSITSVIREWDMDLAAFYLLEDSANV